MKKAAAQIHKTQRGQVALGLMALLLTYVIALEAIDTARLLYYFLAIVLVIAGVRWLVLAFLGFSPTKRS